MSVILTKKVGPTLIISANNPPVNALSQAVRIGLSKAIDKAVSNEAVRSIVIKCEGGTFFAGADIKEFSKPDLQPMLPDVIDKIELCPKPIVAAIHGTALGGGLEIALACHFRVAGQDAKLGLPEVKLGLIPGAGGTQRLPRIIGIQESLPIIALGDTISASKALEIGLLDCLVDKDDLEEEAIALVETALANPTFPITSKLTGKIGSVDDAELAIKCFTEKFSRKLGRREAPAVAIKAIRAAASQHFSDGIKTERELFLRLKNGEQSKALRYVFFAERAAGRIANVDDSITARPIAKVGIIGAGTMGGGISMAFLSAGIPVTIVDRDTASLERGVGIIRKNYEATARKGRLTDDQVEKAMSLLTPTVDFKALAECDLIIEAAFEDMGLKRAIFRRLDSTAKEGAILATNTSYLNIDKMAAETKRPESVVGLHFFSPANVMKLLEVIRGAKTGPDVLKTSLSLARKIGKTAVISGVCHGFIGNRMLTQRQKQARDIILQGPRPWDVDTVLTEFGFPMGPFQMSDLAGLDIGWKAEKSNSSSVHEILCEAGRYGQKTGKGYYDYDENRRALASPETEAIIDQFVEKTGHTQRVITDKEILKRLLYPMVNEGAKILEEGIAQRASDIDTVWLNGYGWPDWTGGPMYWADRVGLRNIVEGLREFRIEPAPLLSTMAKNGQNFSNSPSKK
ncbi:3-hydroxyacyl-CoA dehydrogenase NAD-binding domain-containing protein [Kordiimonas sp.]|uniref:3-hydroxyacyl-CoA dehydrogenase NAD-binding domain-containing protein n=1 Tax=Kordiimonas sp. TaxID=1970157 RepID=UPI003A9361D5